MRQNPPPRADEKRAETTAKRRRNDGETTAKRRRNERKTDEGGTPKHPATRTEGAGGDEGPRMFWHFRGRSALAPFTGPQGSRVQPTRAYPHSKPSPTPRSASASTPMSRPASRTWVVGNPCRSTPRPPTIPQSWFGCGGSGRGARAPTAAPPWHPARGTVQSRSSEHTWARMPGLVWTTTFPEPQ